MLLLMALVLVLVASVFGVAALRLPTKPAVLVGVYISAWANVVLVSELTGSFRLLDYRAFLVLHLVLLALAWLVWHRAGRPPLVPFSLAWDGKKLWASVKAHPELWALGLIVGVVYLIGGIENVLVPPNNNDSLAYHLSRVGYWVQHKSFAPWPTPDPRQITFPINAEIGILWTVILWGTDRWAGFVQGTAAWMGIPIIFALARFLGGSRSSGAFAASIWATWPQIVLQSTTTQTDLLTSVFFLAAIYMLFVGFHDDHRGSLWLSGLAVGLALGTKLTAAMALPGLGVGAILLLALEKGGVTLRRAIEWGVACLIGFTVLGAYIYGLNLVAYGNPLGPTTYVESNAIGYRGFSAPLLKANLLRYGYQAADLTGLPISIQAFAQEVKTSLGSALFKVLRFDPNAPHTTKQGAVFDFVPSMHTHEDVAWFGPLGFVLLVSAVIWQGSVGLAQRDPYRLTLVAGVLGFTVVLCAAMTWSPWRGRYFVLAATVGAPLLVSFGRPGRLWHWLRWGSVALAALVLCWTTLQNQGKPLVGPTAVWGKDRISMQGINFTFVIPAARMIEEYVPPQAILGTVLGSDDMDYLLFGEHFGRTVLPIYPESNLTAPGWLSEWHIDFVVVNAAQYTQTVPGGFYPVAKASDWLLFYRADADSARWEEFRLRLLTNNQAGPENNPLVTGDASLGGKVLIDPVLYVPPWGIESDGEKSWLWLGHGQAEGLTSTLWAAEVRTIWIVLDVTPGGGRQDLVRTIELAVENETGRSVERQQFERSTTLVFAVALQPGRNEWTVQVLEQATVSRQPNADPRPLLARLNQVTVGSLSALLERQAAGPENRPLITVDASLMSIVGIDSSFQTPSWGIEVDADKSWLWLGCGQAEGLAGTLWSAQGRVTRIVLDVAPGAARTDSLRTVELTVENSSGTTTERQQIDQAATLAFGVDLEPGRNDVRVQVLEKATVLSQPNGDTRPLLVLLRHMTVE